MYNVKLQTFEGPFDLLLDLIDRKKLSINEVSLAQVADQYLNYLKNIEQFPVREVAYFIVVAATLMLIKSRSLMPSLELSGEEETEIEDLGRRLSLYNQYRMLAKELETIFGKKVIFGREALAGIAAVFVEPADLSLANLNGALKILIESLPKKEVLPEAVVKKTVSLEQKIKDLSRRLEKHLNFCFSELHKGSECDRLDLIVNFLAILELIKRGMITAKQENIFGEIDISKPQA